MNGSGRPDLGQGLSLYFLPVEHLLQWRWFVVMAMEYYGNKNHHSTKPFYVTLSSQTLCQSSPEEAEILIYTFAGVIAY